MHVVIDPNDLIVSDISQVLDGTRLTGRSRSLKNDSIVTHGNDTGQLFKKSLERFGRHKVLLIETLIPVFSFGNDELLHDCVFVRKLQL